MSAVIRELIDSDSNKVYPVTKADAVYYGKMNMEDVLESIVSSNAEIKFPSTSQIVKTLPSGNEVNTVFNTDGSITETVVNTDGIVLQKKKILFNDDGSISITTESEE